MKGNGGKEKTKAGVRNSKEDHKHGKGNGSGHREATQEPGRRNAE